MLVIVAAAAVAVMVVFVLIMVMLFMVVIVTAAAVAVMIVRMFVFAHDKSLLIYINNVKNYQHMNTCSYVNIIPIYWYVNRKNMRLLRKNECIAFFGKTAYDGTKRTGRTDYL